MNDDAFTGYNVGRTSESQVLECSITNVVLAFQHFLDQEFKLSPESIMKQIQLPSNLAFITKSTTFELGLVLQPMSATTPLKTCRN